MQIVYTYQKNQLPIRLFQAYLLLTLSLLSGYTGTSSISYRQPVQTSWQYTPHRIIPKHTVSYKETITGFYEVNTQNNKNGYQIALLLYNKAEAVKLHTSSAFIAEETIHRFLHPKISPENSAAGLPAFIMA